MVILVHFRRLLPPIKPSKSGDATAARRDLLPCCSALKSEQIRKIVPQLFRTTESLQIVDARLHCREQNSPCALGLKSPFKVNILQPGGRCLRIRFTIGRMEENAIVHVTSASRTRLRSLSNIEFIYVCFTCLKIITILD